MSNVDDERTSCAYDQVLKWFLSMRDSENYLAMEVLQDRHAYTLWAHHAHAGIWIAEESGFLMSRYKLSPVPYLVIDSHWDYDNRTGLVKPLELIGPCSEDVITKISVALASRWLMTAEHGAELCAYLDRLEEEHAVVPGVNTVQLRRASSVRWLERQEKMRLLKASARQR